MVEIYILFASFVCQAATIHLRHESSLKDVHSYWLHLTPTAKCLAMFLTSDRERNSSSTQVHGPKSSY